MANTLDAELVLKLKNADAVLRQLESKIKNSSIQDLGNVSLPPGFVKQIQSLTRALAASQVGAQGTATSVANLARTTGQANSNLQGATPAIKAYANALHQARKEQDALAKAQTRNIGLSEEFGRQTGSIAKRFGGFLIAQAAIRRVGEAFQEAARQAIDFEREIIRLAQFQNTTIEQSKKLGDFIETLSFRFGTSSEALVKSAQILAQAGRSTGEIQSILSALAPASLAGSFGDLNKATDSLNALLGQFDISASRSTQVMDELNAVAEAFNVSIEELFDGLKRAGSSFAALSGVKEGITPGTQALREYAALFTAVIDTTREGADTIGTALKTILPRLQRGQTQSLLKSFGIELLNDKGNFVGPLEAFKRISDGLKGLSAQSPAFSKIVEELGGSRQFGRVLPLLEEQLKIQRAIAIANNASGSVYQDAELAQQSLQVQIQKTLERFKELLRELTQTGTFKAMAASFLGLANASITLANSLKELLPLIAAVAAIQVLKNIPPFSRGFSKGIGFSKNTATPAAFAGGGLVPSKLTPGELVFSPQAVKREGRSVLDHYNKTGDPAGLKSMAGAFIVPGTGNSDTVNMNLPEGSYVIKKSSVNKMRRGFNMGGYASKRRYYQDGGDVGTAIGNRTRFTDIITAVKKIASAAGTPVELAKLPPIMKELEKSITKVTDTAGVALGFFKNVPGFGGISTGRAIALKQTDDPRQLITSLLHELTHTLDVQANIPEYAKNKALAQEQRTAAKLGLKRSGSVGEARAYQFDLNQDFADPTVLAKLEGAKNRDDLKKIVSSLITEAAISTTFKDLSPKQFANFDSAAKATFVKIQEAFFKSAAQAGLTFKEIQSTFTSIANRSANLNDLNSRLGDYSRRVLEPVQAGANLPLLEEREAAKREAKIQTDRAVRRAQKRGIQLSDAALERINADVVANATSQPQLSPSEQRRVTDRSSIFTDRRGEADYLSKVQNSTGTSQGRFIGGVRNFANGARGFFSRPISNPTFGNIQSASFGLGILGGALSSTNSPGGRQAGGALTGAAIGLQSSLVTANPLIIAFSTLAGAAIGASSALKEFELSERRRKDTDVVAQFAQGKASINSVGAALLESANFGFSRKPLAKDAFSALEVSKRSDLASAYRSVGIGSRIASLFSLDGLLNSDFSSVTLAKGKRAEELARVREDFATASQSQADLVREKVVKSFRGGGTISNEKLIAQFTKDPEQARLLALQNKALKDPRQLNDDEQVKQLAAGFVRQLADETRELNRPLSELGKKLADLAQNSAVLFAAFDRINSGLATLGTTMTQLDQNIDATLTGGIANRSPINNFSNPFGVSQGVFGQSINNLAAQLGINELQSPGFSATAQAAAIGNAVKTTLPEILAQSSRNAPLDETIDQTLKSALPTNLSPLLTSYFRDLIDTNFGGQDAQSVKGISEAEIQDIVTKFSGLANVGKDILSITQDLANQNTARRNQQATAVANAQLGIAQQGIGLNQLGVRRGNAAAEILGIRSPQLAGGAALASLNQDLSTILGKSVTATLAPQNLIRGRLAEINRTGVTAENVGEFTKLTEALKLLSSDTRILDATMQKANELNQAQQGSRNVIDRLLGGGPQEILKFNQQLRDFQAIAAGGDVGGPRALEALSTMEQLLGAISPDQFKGLTGISKDQAEASLRGIRAEQGGRIFGGDLGGLLAGNIRGDGKQALVDEANKAFDIMRQAGEILKQQSEAQLAIATEQMAAQQKLFTEGVAAAFNNAFSSQGSLDLQRSLNQFSQSFGEGASLEVTGKTDVIVTFNGANSVFKDIEKDLEAAIGRIVNGQISAALKNQNGIQGANAP